MTPKDVADSVLLLGPGFVLLKVVYLSGGQHERLQWEWVVWSVLTSLGLAAAASYLAGFVPGTRTAGPLGPSDFEVGLRFGLAVTLGLVGGRTWAQIRRSSQPWMRRLTRMVADSAWDVILDDASRTDKKGHPLFGVEVAVSEGSGQASYYGKLAAFGYEAAAARPSIYLTDVSRWSDANSRYETLARTEGMLFDGDKIARLRVIARIEVTPGIGESETESTPVRGS